ncbi:MAG: YceI family protein [Gemmatimonadota bacterium]|nr:MAG: YceI family protein [Gemmatimonadota bacterium]
MKKLLIVPGILATGALTMAASGGQPTLSTSPWNVDGAHTEVNFSVRHFFTPVSGSFDDYQVTLDFDPDYPENSTVEVQINVASVNTGNEKRDNHLRSGDWFEVEKYPHITFKSTSVQSAGADQLLAKGYLTIKDVTEEVELKVKLLGVKDIPKQMRDMLGGVVRVASFQATTELDRRDFGVGVGSWAETVVVGADVEIEIAVEANHK